MGLNYNIYRQNFTYRVQLYEGKDGRQSYTGPKS